MKRIVTLIAISLLTTACQSTNDGVTRLDNCVCYKSPEGQHLQASQIAWNDPDTLQKQFSHCVCRALVDLKEVDDPGKLFVPGTQIK
ncbi:hypothetical protein [Pseudomonas sp. G(2018)]|uniref:hypothetical protein n=1 Tax=Pseudomonas sp. G(2018) TaxID=2502242 RepID=UPI0010F5E530|nr:hypothetical protein [Pseudomonas sp. G(2018)]